MTRRVEPKKTVLKAVPPTPIEVVPTAFLRFTWGDVVRVVFGWEFFMRQRIVWPDGDVAKAPLVHDVAVQPVAPAWWARARRITNRGQHGA